jgi:oligoribonuclease NrnB/cAMP/cGMP phosphodiesterase (DHH superfamily)
MNRKQIETQIVLAHTANDFEKITSIYVELVNLRGKLDRWFNKYLDMFDEKMNASTRSDPVWKLYHKKSDEYSDVVQTIKTAEYYLKKP